MSYIYFSYSAMNRNIVKEIASNLDAYSLQTWIDFVRLQQNDNWQLECQNALQLSKGVVGFLSTSSLRLKRLNQEWNWCLEHNHPIIFISLLNNKYEERKIPAAYRDVNFIEHEKISTDLNSFITSVKSKFYL